MKKPHVYSSDPAFMDIYNRITENMEAEEKTWAEYLKNSGITAAHPDDGWVDRINNSVVLCYPCKHLSATAGKGDLIALGDPEQWRIVRVIRVIKGITGLLYYRFEDAGIQYTSGKKYVQERDKTEKRQTALQRTVSQIKGAFRYFNKRARTRDKRTDAE